MPGQLQGDVAIITGGSSGIGRASAIRFAEAGAAVVIGDLQPAPREGGTPTDEMITQSGGTARFVRCDVTNGEDRTQLVAAAKRHNVTIVVHEANPSAGIANRLGAHLTTHVFTGHPETKLRNSKYLGLPIRRQIADLDRFALGDKARAHFGLRPDLPVLLVFGGSQGARSLNRALAGAVGAIRSAGVQVLHITGPKHLGESQQADGPLSPGGTSVPYVALPYVDRMDLAYAAADFALCRSLAGEWGPRGVRVNCVAPGLVKTDFARALWEDEERLKRRCETTPLRRIGEPDEIAGAVAYLGSDASSFMTGQTIVVDGGVTTAAV